MSAGQDSGGGPITPEGASPPSPGWSSSSDLGGGTVPPAPGGGFQPTGSAGAFNAGAGPSIAGLPLAGNGRRFVGYIIDAIIFWIVWLPLSIVFSSTTNVVTTIGTTSITTQERTISPFIEIILLVAGLAYFTLLWSSNGSSVGQMVVGVRVVDASTGAPVSQTQALVRAIGYIISAIPIYIGFIWAFFDSRKQGWMDKMANTLVVRIRQP
ncbi:MAG: RDD family protein [Candidatus Dormiibacterota bacterium]